MPDCRSSGPRIAPPWPASAAGLSLAPRAFARVAGSGTASGALRINAWAVGLAGIASAGASAWAMGHDLIRRAVTYCPG